VHLLYFEEDLLHVDGYTLNILFIVVSLLAQIKIYIYWLLYLVFINFHSDTFKNWVLKELKCTRSEVGVYLKHVSNHLNESWITTG
jgi:phage-related holin